MTAEARSRSVALVAGADRDRGHAELTPAAGAANGCGHTELTFAAGAVEVWWTSLDTTTVARAWVRATLATRLGIAPERVAIVKDRHGKPHLRGAAAPAFSISHCDGFAALALGPVASVGIDIEPASRVPRAGAIERLLSVRERATLVGLPPRAHARALLGYWTLREAAAKALGTGLGANLHRLEILDGPDGPRPRDRTLGQIELRRWRPSPEVIGAVAVAGGHDASTGAPLRPHRCAPPRSPARPRARPSSPQRQP